MDIGEDGDMKKSEQLERFEAGKDYKVVESFEYWDYCYRNTIVIPAGEILRFNAPSFGGVARFYRKGGVLLLIKGKEAFKRMGKV